VGSPDRLLLVPLGEKGASRSAGLRHTDLSLFAATSDHAASTPPERLGQNDRAGPEGGERQTLVFNFPDNEQLRIDGFGTTDQMGLRRLQAATLRKARRG
jgi:hypothetical protein